jgi:hypothetical protein
MLECAQIRPSTYGRVNSVTQNTNANANTNANTNTNYRGQTESERTAHTNEHHYTRDDFIRANCAHYHRIPHYHKCRDHLMETQTVVVHVHGALLMGWAGHTRHQRLAHHGEDVVVLRTEKTQVARVLAVLNVSGCSDPSTRC